MTALVDQIDFTASFRCSLLMSKMINCVLFRADCDIRMSGHITWVGSSSAESSLQLEQLVDGEWKRWVTSTKDK